MTGTRNRPAAFRRLVASIAAHTPGPWELVVADASDEAVDDRGLPANVTILPERPRLGCTRGYNMAFRYAKGDWVLWLNDDVEVTPGYAHAAIEFMETHPQVGLGALYYRENQMDYHVNACCYGLLYANFGILRRELGEQVGWLDEELTMYGGDNSLTYRVLLAGKGVAGIPAARVIHHSENDAERIANNNSHYRHLQAEILKAKYGPRLPEIRRVYELTGGTYRRSHEFVTR